MVLKVNSQLMNPYFSIIIPTFNRAHLISRAIDSVIAQTFENWELIIVDDGSTDNTKELIANYQKKDTRIRYIYQENAERSAARNNGIKNANSIFTCFLDSDDLFDKNHLNQFSDAINSKIENKHIYISKSKIINSEGIVLAISNIVLGKTDAETILMNTITPGQMCVSTNLLLMHLFNEKIRISEDTELIFRLISNVQLQIVEQATLLYVQHENNSVNPLRYNAYKERKKTLQFIFSNNFGNNVSNSLKRKVLSDCFFGIAKYHAAKNHSWLVRWTMMKAIVYYPEFRSKEKFFLIIYPQKAI